MDDGTEREASVHRGLRCGVVAAFDTPHFPMKSAPTTPSLRARGSRLSPLVAVGFLAAACHTPEPAPFVLRPPALVIEQSLEPGSPLGPPGEAHDAEAGKAAATIPARCRFLYLREPRTAELQALGTDAAMVADLSGGTPVLPTPELTLSTLYAEGPPAVWWIAELDAAAATDAQELVAQSGFIPVGTSFRLSVQSHERVEDPRDWLDEFDDRGPFPREIEVVVGATEDGLQIALEVTNLDPTREAELVEEYQANPNVLATPPGPAQDEIVRRELLTVRPHPTLGSPLVLHMDSPFSEGNGSAIAIVIEVLAPADVEGMDEAEAAATVASAAAARELERTPITEEHRQAIGKAESLEVYRQRGGRAALLQVAQETDAALTEDLALVADEAFLLLLTERAFPPGTLQAENPEAPAVEREGIGWRLDAASWTVLAEGALEETLDKELEGVLFRRAGALATFPDVLLDSVRGAGGIPKRFHQRLVIEQLYFLEDPNDSLRLRAYDWLKEYGVIVPGYDPLAERDERRVALEAARETVAQQVQQMTLPSASIGADAEDQQ